MKKIFKNFKVAHTKYLVLSNFFVYQILCFKQKKALFTTVKGAFSVPRCQKNLLDFPCKIQYFILKSY